MRTNLTWPVRQAQGGPCSGGCFRFFRSLHLLPAILVLALAGGLPRWSRAESVVVACVGDFGAAAEGTNNAAAELAVADLIKRWNPQFVITTGDNNYPDGGADDIDLNIGQFYHEFIHPYVGTYGMGATSNRFFPCLGNHDVLTSDGAPYVNYFTLPGNERYYRYRSGPVEVFAVNSNPDADGTTATSVQGRWLQAQLADSTARWKLVYFHHPPYSGTPGGPGTPGMRWPFAAWGATAVFAGHEHSYARIFTNDIYYFVNGLGGDERGGGGQSGGAVQVAYNGDFGAMRLQATESNLVMHFLTRNDVIIDSLVLGEPMRAPFFLASPISQEVVAGSTVTFRAQAAGPQPLRYQWLTNDVELLNATNQVLQIPNVQVRHESQYSVRVTGGGPNPISIVSSAATLTLLRHPLITRHPLSQSTSSSTVTFSVAAAGAGTLRFQWLFNAEPISGATNATLVLSNVFLSAIGDYQARVTDDLGSILSQAAHLVVLARPRIEFQPLSQSAPVGGTVTFSISAMGTLPMNFSWRQSGRIVTNLMLNQTTCFWTLRNVQPTNAGPYTVGITNIAGAASNGLSRAALLTVLADTDGDGMPDEWEIAHGLRPQDSSDATADSDGDGQDNVSEYRAGTEPDSATSCLRLESPTRAGADAVHFQFNAVSNRSYGLESRKLPGGLWAPVRSWPAVETNRVITVTESVSTPPVLYRVLTPPAQ